MGMFVAADRGGQVGMGVGVRVRVRVGEEWHELHSGFWLQP